MFNRGDFGRGSSGRGREDEKDDSVGSGSSRGSRWGRARGRGRGRGSSGSGNPEDTNNPPVASPATFTFPNPSAPSFTPSHTFGGEPTATFTQNLPTHLRGPEITTEAVPFDSQQVFDNINEHVKPTRPGKTLSDADVDNVKKDLGLRVAFAKPSPGHREIKVATNYFKLNVPERLYVYVVEMFRDFTLTYSSIMV
ncbi:hypothetical protein BAUCODRAFT_155024 [Baudoinia panamericana UAMH 10762]|uniref:Uncharacterized protein n=1 Tax=Baudoinia panamericana (strain UAMH 10762) TaxID=717646 RepID=M2LXH0_BAUPA|nr:uncharacterized protein BAUCODRAFT_155024 [Baudoinia panamericana UAMH 10762]EMC99397.1 hypothetical protein BAUCODRAFT_155024 [Baudoinia panamericana UAMH 10762]